MDFSTPLQPLLKGIDNQNPPAPWDIMKNNIGFCALIPLTSILSPKGEEVKNRFPLPSGERVRVRGNSIFIFMLPATHLSEG
jgi:hypothetical protein